MPPTKQSSKSAKSKKAAPPVVAIGASAGGIEAFQKLVATLPKNGGIAWVFIQHMAPDRESHLEPILARNSTLSIEQVTKPTALQADHIYLIAPGQHLSMREGILQVTEVKVDGLRTPIDEFFLSLAKECKGRCGCALLSGTGADGAIGLKAIKESGGVAFTQSARTAEHAGMIHNALSTGLVDREMPVEEMGQAFADFFHQSAAPEAQEIDPKILSEIFKILRERTRHDFSDYKKKTMNRRVRRRMQAFGIEKPEDYLARLRSEKAEAHSLLADLLIGVTHFFRDPEAFKEIEAKTIPEIMKHKTHADTVRVWVPGCATGEEAYTFTMLLLEYAEKMDSPPKVQVFGSDIDDNALQIARHGRYPFSIEADVSPERLKRFFEKEDGTYRVRSHVREVCLFSSHNILHDPPFSRLHIISCRNLMIYLSADLQNRLVPVLHYALVKGGYLFISPAETIAHNSGLFVQSGKSHRIYRKVEEVSRLPEFPIAGGDGVRKTDLMPAVTSLAKVNLNRAQGVTLRRALEKYAPAYVVINQRYEISEASTGTGHYLELPAGAPILNLETMVNEDLRLDLKLAMARVLTSGERVSRTVMRGRAALGKKAVNIIIEPMPGLTTDTPLYLVVFQDTDPPKQEAVKSSKRPDHDDLVGTLEQDLRITRARLETATEELDTTNEELRASNEELSSVNEELKSSNEELETSKEELQSINEELRTVNVELNERVEDLSVANTDLKNLFANTQVPIVFLDSNLNIKSFTPPAQPLFQLRNHDIGRPISELSAIVDIGDIEKDAKQLFDQGLEAEREVYTRSKPSLTFLYRLQSYRDSHNEADGAVLTLVDITERKRAEKQLAAMVRELSHRVKNNLATVIAIARQTAAAAKDVNDFVATFEGRLKAMARAHSYLLSTSWVEGDLATLAATVLEPFSEESDDHLKISGPEVKLTPEKALTMAMIFQELATNAAKYGAWSTSNGGVHLSWRPHELNRSIIIEWREQGGPLPVEPKQYGFGLNFIADAVAHEMSGSAKISFLKQGLVCQLEFGHEGLK